MSSAVTLTLEEVDELLGNHESGPGGALPHDLFLRCMRAWGESKGWVYEDVKPVQWTRTTLSTIYVLKAHDSRPKYTLAEHRERGAQIDEEVRAHQEKVRADPWRLSPAWVLTKGDLVVCHLQAWLSPRNALLQADEVLAAVRFERGVMHLPKMEKSEFSDDKLIPYYVWHPCGSLEVPIY